MSDLSIDKCLGPKCPCVTIEKPIRIISKVDLRYVSLTIEPSLFPGGGFVDLESLKDSEGFRRRG